MVKHYRAPRVVGYTWNMEAVISFKWGAEADVGDTEDGIYDAIEPDDLIQAAIDRLEEIKEKEHVEKANFIAENFQCIDTEEEF